MILPDGLMFYTRDITEAFEAGVNYYPKYNGLLDKNGKTTWIELE